MSSEQDALPLLMESVLSLRPWLRDPRVVPIPWRKDILIETLSRATEDGSSNNQLPLKIGILYNDGVVTPHPPIQRGVRLVAQAVESAGHKVSQIELVDFENF